MCAAEHQDSNSNTNSTSRKTRSLIRVNGIMSARRSECAAIIVRQNVGSRAQKLLLFAHLAALASSDARFRSFRRTSASQVEQKASSHVYWVEQTYTPQLQCSNHDHHTFTTPGFVGRRRYGSAIVLQRAWWFSDCGGDRQGCLH